MQQPIDERYVGKGNELKVLYEEFKKNPALFNRETFVDDNAILQKFGIYIKDKEKCVKGYVKLWPQDFIVEEISKTGEVYSIEKKNLVKDSVVEESELPSSFVTLVKCNISTIEAVKDISKQLSCELSQIQFAGIKDKDAITSQRISIRNVPVKKIKEVSSPFFFLKDLEKGKGVIDRGNLKGNSFSILVRTDSHFGKEIYDEMIKKIDFLGKNGFYNFFYLQRFGTPRLLNYIWAILILKGKYKEAVWNFFSGTGVRESIYFTEKRKEIKSCLGDWKKVVALLQPFPLIFANDIKVASYLVDHPSDYVGALNQIPDQINLWMMALSSLFFNLKISSCLKKNIEVPKTLTPFLSLRREDWDPYRTMLTEANIYPVPAHNLKPFKFLQLMPRPINTLQYPEVHKIELLKEGVAIHFSLLKGEYATTFLSYLFDLLSYKVPEDILDTQIDLKQILSEKNNNETLEYFKNVNRPKTENAFDLIKGE